MSERKLISLYPADELSALMQNLEPYRTIGPMTEMTVPKGLLGVHNLKPETWALLNIIEGKIHFVWDQRNGRTDVLEQGDQVLIPPIEQHHLKLSGAVKLTIDFMRKKVT